MIPANYAPGRVWKAFRFLLTVFLIFRHRERFLFLTPLSPKALKAVILELGVCFIKLSQVLATRADFFEADYLEELKTILDEVEPMPEKDFRIMFHRAFGDDPPFADFEEKPMASASIGQVHRARLADGSEAAVKIRRLGIERQVRHDVRIVTWLLTLFQPFFSRYTKNSLDAVIAEFSAMIAKEVDMAKELDNLRKFHETYQIEGVRFPDFHAEISGRDALVMSFERGARIDDKEALAAYDVSFSKVMERLIDFYAEQMLVKGIFHADPHPGNILITEEGGIVLLDFGMVKRLPSSTRVAMIEVVKAAHEQDFELFVTACKRLGIVAPGAPEEQLQEMSERMFDIFSNDSLSARSMQELAFEVLDSLKDFPFKVPQEIVYVMRASALMEGLGTNYLENYNGIKDILPVLLKNMNRAMGADAGLFPTLKSEFTAIPMTARRLHTIITDLSESNLTVKLSPETVELVEERLRRLLKPLGLAAALLAAAFFCLLADFAHHQTTAIILFALAALRLFTALR